MAYPIAFFDVEILEPRCLLSAAPGLGGMHSVGSAVGSYYVSPTGSVSNLGTQSSPWPSVAFALSQVGGGNTIILEPGTYSPILVHRGDGGTSAHPTVIESQYKWRAVIDGTLNPAVEGLASETPCVIYTANYVTFDGFKVVNAGTFGINLGGDWNVAENCWVTGSKYTGIGSWGHNYTIVQNNLVEYNGTSTQLDHGIYMSGYGLVVSGNIVRHNSGLGIDLAYNVQNCTISGNLLYGQQSGMNFGFSGTLVNTNNTVTNKYSGTLTSGVIKGKMEYERNGEAQSRDWEAKLRQ